MNDSKSGRIVYKSSSTIFNVNKEKEIIPKKIYDCDSNSSSVVIVEGGETILTIKIFTFSSSLYF